MENINSELNVVYHNWLAEEAEAVAEELLEEAFMDHFASDPRAFGPDYPWEG